MKKPNPKKQTPKGKTPAVATTAHPLVGKWFHSYKTDAEVIEWQGHILAAAGQDLFLVQLFEWFVGTPSKQILWPLSGMVRWVFYDTNAQMRDAYEIYTTKQQAREAPEEP